MDVRASFTGLCAFVENSVNPAMRVVLVSPSTTPCDKHQPGLIIPVAYWDQTLNPNRKIIDSFYDPDLATHVVALALDQEDLVFPPGTVKFNVKRGSLTDCPNGNADVFNWVASIKEFISSGAMTNTVLTDPSPTGAVARIRMTSGEFTTLSFREGVLISGTKGVVIYKFKDSAGNTVARPLAEEILWRDSSAGSGGIFEIKATAFGGGARPSVKLKQAGGLVEFKVVNLPFDKIKTPDPTQAFKRDDCFSKFYGFGSMVGDTPVPVSDSVCPPQGGAGLSNPKCPSVSFDPNPNA
jgi:hypothetical protein